MAKRISSDILTGFEHAKGNWCEAPQEALAALAAAMRQPPRTAKHCSLWRSADQPAVVTEPGVVKIARRYIALPNQARARFPYLPPRSIF
jgi:hypothetical protein